MSLPEIAWEDLTDECPTTSELTRHFRAKNDRGIANCLAQLKSDPKRCGEFIRQTHSLIILVHFLCWQNTAIISMSLSILADACMTFDAREKVKCSKIGYNVVLIIKNVKLDAKLHCRACRLIGNLSECSWHAKELCNAGVIKALARLLMSKTDVQTYLMAVRAVRNIWNFYEGSRENMVQHDIIKLVAHLFASVEEKSSNTGTKFVTLIDACLKAMCAFLDTLDSRCGLQMQAEYKDMRGYKSLMRCCSVGNNKMAIKCFYNLCRIGECRLLLGIAGAVEQLITLINSKHQYEELPLSLCLFSRESVNRDRIKSGTGLQLLVSLLKKPEQEHHHPILLQALSEFIYDDIAIAILLKHGLLEVLVAKLTDMVAVAMNSEKCNLSRKRSIEYSPEDQKTAMKYRRSYLRRFSMDYYYRNDWSPKSATSASSSSPPSTPPLPLCSDSNAETDDSEDNVYSPICSDIECGDNDEEEESASLTSCKSLTININCSDYSSFDSETSSKASGCEYHTLLLLNRLSLYSEPIDRLADPMIIKPLTAYIKVKYTKINDIQNLRLQSAIKILIRIMGNQAYFLPLLNQGLVFEVQTLPKSDEYTQHLRNVAETGGAIGHMSFMLLRGEKEQKQLTAVSIPLLIKTHATLNRLLYMYKGLQLIFRVLTESSHELYERAILSICQLAKTLQIDPVYQSNIPSSTNSSALCDYSRLSSNETNYSKPTISSTVTFELDDGTTVDACRQILCRRSDVFYAMLNGNFNESGKRRVRLKNTSARGLNTLILAANGAAYDHQSIESLLDAVLMADKFLMPDLSETLTESFATKLNHENFCRAWNWARSHFCHELRSSCIRSFLIAEMSWSESVRAFRDFYDTDGFDEFLLEVEEIIVGALCLGR